MSEKKSKARRTGIVLNQEDEFLYSQTATGYLQQEKYSKPLPTASGYMQLVYRNQEEGNRS